jgi:uncharacterized membrane protein YvbJ
MKNESNENQVLYKSSIESTNQQNKLIKKKTFIFIRKMYTYPVIVIFHFLCYQIFI